MQHQQLIYEYERGFERLADSDGEALDTTADTVARLKAERDALKVALAKLLEAAAAVYDAYINTLMDNDGYETPAAKLLFPNGGNPMTD